MAQTKTKIVLDADVVIHFMKGDCFTLLLELFPKYQYLILDIVYDELAKSPQTKAFIDNITTFMPQKLLKIPFKPSGTTMLEYAQLIRKLGKEKAPVWFTVMRIKMFWEAAIYGTSKIIAPRTALLTLPLLISYIMLIYVKS